MLHLALTTFFAEEVATEYIIADFAELCVTSGFAAKAFVTH